MQQKGNKMQNASAELLLFDRMKNYALRRRAIKVRGFCKHELEYIHSNGLFRFFNSHGIIHSENILKIMDDFLTTASLSNKGLDEYEIFLLYISAYCHDLGLLMFPRENFEDVEKCHEVRANHCKRIVRYLEDNWQEMGLLNETEVMVLSSICQAHGSKEELGLLQEINYVRLEDNDGKNYSVPVRERLLAAILRLADALDADESRLPYKACRENNNNIIPFVQHIEYYKHEAVDAVIIEPEEQIIKIHLKIKYEDPVDQNGKPINIIEGVQKALNKEFDSVKGILNKDLIEFKRLEFVKTKGPHLKKRRPLFINEAKDEGALEPVDSTRWLLLEDLLSSQ